MRTVTKLIAGGISAFAATAMAISPAMASAAAAPRGTDPTSAPTSSSIVGVGSDTTQYLMDQLSLNYNATSPAHNMFSWDAINPATLAIGDTITFKQGCTPEPRPDGSGAGISALASNEGGTTKGFPCLDFARSSRARTATDPTYGKGGVAFTELARDAISWSSYASGDAPANLTVADLTGIYECTITNWDQVGGKNATIKAFLPQTSSGTRSTFLTDIGVTTPGACVSDGATKAEPDGTIEENEGINSNLHTAAVIFPFSVGSWVSQNDRSAKCTLSSCKPSGGAICKPTGSQNKFGCDEVGPLVLKEIAGTKPTTGTGTSQKINTGFDPAFFRVLYDVVRYDPNTSNHIPAGESGSPDSTINLNSLFGATGYACTNSTAKTEIADYGFLTTTACGTTS